MRITCPHCETSYLDHLCGVNCVEMAELHQEATIVCSVCKGEFDVTAAQVPVETVSVSRWLRRKTVTTTHTPTFTSKAR